MKKEINKINFMELNAYKYVRNNSIKILQRKFRIKYSNSKYLNDCNYEAVSPGVEPG